MAGIVGTITNLSDFSMLKKILMEKEVIPKILALKYILTYFDGKPHAKEEYKSVYSVFCAAVLFTVFANKKESDTFYNFKCSYSKGYYGLLNKSPRMYFQRYPTEKEIDSFSTEEDARAYLNEYFTKTFPEEFLQFSTALVKKINWGS